MLRESEVDVGPHAPGEFSYGTWALTEPENSPAARRADALRHLAETFLAGLSEETDGTPSAARYQVVVHVDQAVLTQAVAASGRMFPRKQFPRRGARSNGTCERASRRATRFHGARR